jgi:hypothetical protein
MSGFVDWIGAAADDAYPKDALNQGLPLTPADEQSLRESSPTGEPGQDLPAHNFPTRVDVPDDMVPNDIQLDDDPLDRNPDLWLYRGRTAAMLRRYMRYSVETGRLPSIVGREFFRAKVTSYTATTFEDRVIFVRDVEKSLDRLEYWDQQLIARIILQEHSQEETARILHWGLRTVERRLPQVLDLISEDFLRVGLLTELPAKRKVSQ